MPAIRATASATATPADDLLGSRIVTLRGEIDLDHCNRERHTPPGSVGYIFQVQQGDPPIYDVYFPANGGWVKLEHQELHDPAQYRIAGPPGVLTPGMMHRYPLAHGGGCGVTCFEAPDGRLTVLASTLHVPRAEDHSPLRSQVLTDLYMDPRFIHRMDGLVWLEHYQRGSEHVHRQVIAEGNRLQWIDRSTDTLHDLTGVHPALLAPPTVAIRACWMPPQREV